MKPLQLSSPHLIIMVGAPGAGKTQFATEFAKMFNAPMLSSDTLRELSSDDTLIHKAAIDLLRELLKPKQTIIFDGNTEKRAWRSDIAKVAREAGFKHCSCGCRPILLCPEPGGYARTTAMRPCLNRNYEPSRRHTPASPIWSSAAATLTTRRQKRF